MKRNHQLRQALKTGDLQRIREAKQGETFVFHVWVHEYGPDGEIVKTKLMTKSSDKPMPDWEINDLSQIDFSKGNQIVCDEDDLKL